VIGVVERDGGTLYCTTLLFSPEFTTRGDFPSDIPNTLAEQPGDVVSTGGSCTVGPVGEVLARSGARRRGDPIADLDLDEIARGKFDFDVVGHYGRPDVFRLSVDERPPRPVDPGQ
jgi:nitrilase